MGIDGFAFGIDFSEHQPCDISAQQPVSQRDQGCVPHPADGVELQRAEEHPDQGRLEQNSFSGAVQAQMEWRLQRVRSERAVSISSLSSSSFPSSLTVDFASPLTPSLRTLSGALESF